jgi:hypothetical protein
MLDNFETSILLSPSNLEMLDIIGNVLKNSKRGLL